MVLRIFAGACKTEKAIADTFSEHSECRMQIHQCRNWMGLVMTGAGHRKVGLGPGDAAALLAGTGDSHFVITSQGHPAPRHQAAGRWEIQYSNIPNKQTNSTSGASYYLCKDCSTLVALCCSQSPASSIITVLKLDIMSMPKKIELISGLLCVNCWLLDRIKRSDTGTQKVALKINWMV